MKKKITNEEIGQIIGKLADKIRKEMNEDLITATNEMQFAEMDLVETLTNEQKVLYDKFIEKREKYYSIASCMYEKKY